MPANERLEAGDGVVTGPDDRLEVQHELAVERCVLQGMFDVAALAVVLPQLLVIELDAVAAVPFGGVHRLVGVAYERVDRG